MAPYKVGNGGCPAITLLSSLPGGKVGQLYAQSLSATPAGNYSYALTGALPPGVARYSSLLYGYPTLAGSYNFTITATSAGNCTGSQAYTLSVGETAALAKLRDFDGAGQTDPAV